ncbi:hypothetical protein P3H15_28310 [Rhodococcus sp. T2V]|uniref:hypothetical protein n=1 Tax=Rhodococcus sp. T2V TaxID=3034164 RepID=UPI0023E2D7CF|nr:hypothetical protein [Rhodococcus sp. T2V]MDF3308922.1 hypothetical protein [Rhodococcus sp. T2V]
MSVPDFTSGGVSDSKFRVGGDETDGVTGGDEEVEVRVETAYYYPAPYWNEAESNGLKPLLLFFDDVSILLPRYMTHRPELADPILAGPMSEQGLLRVLEPETFVDQQMTEDLATVIVNLITDGAFDDLNTDGTYYQELSASRMGWDADIGLAQMLVNELQERDLARPSEDGVSIPLHPAVRTTILVILAQLARSAGRRQGLSLHPVTSQWSRTADLMQTLSRSPMPSAGHLVSLDIEPVAINLESVPLDEILDFRDQHREQYQSYMRDCRRFLIELGPLPPAERTILLQDRREELQDRAFSLRRTAQRAWNLNQMATFGLGIAGAAWELVGKHDPVSAAIVAAGAGVATIAAGSTDIVDAYSYIVDVGRTFSMR